MFVYLESPWVWLNFASGMLYPCISIGHNLFTIPYLVWYAAVSSSISWYEISEALSEIPKRLQKHFNGLCTDLQCRPSTAALLQHAWVAGRDSIENVDPIGLRPQQKLKYCWMLLSYITILHGLGEPNVQRFCWMLFSSWTVYWKSLVSFLRSGWPFFGWCVAKVPAHLKWVPDRSRYLA